MTRYSLLFVLVLGACNADGIQAPVVYPDGGTDMVPADMTPAPDLTKEPTLEIRGMLLNDVALLPGTRATGTYAVQFVAHGDRPIDVPYWKLSAFGTIRNTRELVNFDLTSDRGPVARNHFMYMTKEDRQTMAMDWVDQKNTLPTSVVEGSPVTISLDYDVENRGFVMLGDFFTFLVGADDVYAVDAETRKKITVWGDGGGPMLYIAPFHVTVEAVSPAPGSTTTQVVADGSLLAHFKYRNQGTCLISFMEQLYTMKGSYDGQMYFRLMFSDLNSANGGLNPQPEMRLNGFDFTMFDHKTSDIYGETYRVAAVQVVSLGGSHAGSSWTFGLAQLGSALYCVEETDLGYDGDGDGALRSRICNLPVEPVAPETFPINAGTINKQ